MGTALTTLEAAAPTVDCGDAAALLADSVVLLLWLKEFGSAAFPERVLGVTASGAGEPDEGAGEP